MTEKRYFVTCEVGDCICELISQKLSDDEFEHLTYQDITDRLNELAEENEQLKQLLDYADDLIQSHLSEHFIRQWRNFKTGHKEYNDFWEEKLKKHKELKENVE